MVHTVIPPAELTIFQNDFKKFDTNASGALDGQECKDMAKYQLGDDTPEEKLEKLIAEMDSNADGKIEFDEYMTKILGEGWAAAEPDAITMETVKCGRTYCTFADMPGVVDKIYNEMKMVPLVCAVDKEKAAALSAFWNYQGHVQPTKKFVGMAMHQGKEACWAELAASIKSCLEKGSNLVLQMSNGATNLIDIAKCTGNLERTTFVCLFDVERQERAHGDFPAVELEHNHVHPDFRITVVSEFVEEDIEDFFSHNQIPLEKCHLCVVNEM